VSFSIGIPALNVYDDAIRETLAHPKLVAQQLRGDWLVAGRQRSRQDFKAQQPVNLLSLPLRAK
jgi:hypothetical protein